MLRAQASSRGVVAILFLTLLGGAGACRDAPEKASPPPTPSAPKAQVEAPRDSVPHVPRNLGDALPSPERNPGTPAGIALGRSLFHDPMLSGSNTVACATCHIQAKAFSDGIPISAAGDSGEPVLRHSPVLINLAWHPRLFWDGGGSDLESQAFGPVQHKDEMGQNFRELRAELAEHPVYPTLFDAAFSDGLTIPNIVRALAQFQRSLISANSRYDRHVRGEPGGSLTDPEVRGLTVFREKCSVCHLPDHFTDHVYHNVGLDTEYPLDHERLAWGRARISNDEADKGAFKTPTLRNVAVSAPYMHDGRLPTLRSALERYRSGVKDTPTLDPLLRGPDGSLGIALSDDEVTDLLAFLETLTDEEFLTATRFQPHGE